MVRGAAFEPSDPSAVDAAIEAIYGAAAGPETWTDAVDRIGEALGAGSAVLQVVAGPSWAGAVPSTALGDEFVPGLLEWANSPHNPFRHTHLDQPLLHRPLVRADVVSDAAFRESPFYCDFMRHHGCFHGIGVISRLGEQGTVLLSLNRPEEELPFSARERERLALLSRHVGRSAALGRRVAEARRDLETAALVCDAALVACLVLDGRGNVALANEAARRLLDGDGRVGLEGDRLAFLRESDARRLDALRQAAAGGELALHQPGEPPLFVWMVPLRPSEAPLLAPQRGHLLILVDPAADPGLHADALVRALGLTPTEAQLACRLVSHDTLADAARDLGITRNTAKMHQRNLYAKLGVGTRAALVRTVLQLRIRLPG